MCKSSVANLADVFTRRAACAKAVSTIFPDATLDPRAEEEKYESAQVATHPDRKAEYFVEGPGTGRPSLACRWYVEIKPRKLAAIRVYDRATMPVALEKVADMLNQQLLKSA